MARVVPPRDGPAARVPPRDAMMHDSSDDSDESSDAGSARPKGAGVFETPGKPGWAAAAALPSPDADRGGGGSGGAGDWETHVSSSTGQHYWFNARTSVSTYEMPPELQGLPVLSDISSLDESEFARRVEEDFPAEAADAAGGGDGRALPVGWESHVSSSTGAAYYFCAATGETTYDFPKMAMHAGPAARNDLPPRDIESVGVAQTAQDSPLAVLMGAGATAVDDEPAAAPVAPVAPAPAPVEQKPLVDPSRYKGGEEYRGPEDDKEYWKTQTSNASDFLTMAMGGAAPAHTD